MEDEDGKCRRTINGIKENIRKLEDLPHPTNKSYNYFKFFKEIKSNTTTPQITIYNSCKFK